MLNSHRKPHTTFSQRFAVMIAAASISTLGISGVSAMLSPAAHASTGVETRTKIVRFHDLDLTSDRDRSVLNRRISRAAKQVCTDVGINAVINQRKNRACAKTAYSKAWSQVERRMGRYQIAAQPRD